jgi:TolB protein
MKTMRVLAVIVMVAGLAALAVAQSRDVRIDITSGQGRKIRLHCESLAPEGSKNAREYSVQADDVLAKDLDYSGVFAVTRSWVTGEQAQGVQGIVSGKWIVSGNQVKLQGEVSDFPARRPILVQSYRGAMSDWRSLVHQFADDIVLQFTGELGSAQTRFAFVGQIGRDKELYVMDYDGANLKALTKDRSLALSPAWSPEGSLLLFTSYRGGRGPQVFVIGSNGGRPFLISGRSGLQHQRVVLADGRSIACTLSQDGNSEIYTLNARGGSPHRVTNHRSIDTSPTWSPTGQEIAFTSDRSGTPEVYVMDAEGGNLRRLTYGVSYTDSPAWSPKGDRIAFVARTSAGFDIYVCRADGKDTRLVVSGGSNENPHWSPDGRHLLFSSDRGGSRALFVTDLDDRPARKIDTNGLPAFTPAWSPRLPNNRSAMNLESDHSEGGKR